MIEVRGDGRPGHADRRLGMRLRMRKDMDT